jgi:uncharacterized membrane protein YciS (DUF1049 family)
MFDLILFMLGFVSSFFVCGAYWKRKNIKWMNDFSEELDKIILESKNEK